MKLNSSIFDSIRVKPDKERATQRNTPQCEWEGCDRPGVHRAPKGRDQEGQYFRFCIDHVKAYNKSYNYFNGMDDDAVRTYQKDSATGHRPTWKMGVNSDNFAAGGSKSEPDMNDPHDFFAGRGERAPQKPRRKVLALEKRSLEALNLTETATSAEIKSRYKELVKIHHPDANGGDRSCEDRLREVIQAYNTLKKAGLC
ncbi:molecular chaperone DnaJ [Rhodobacteraceae bacterium RKSG542]|uniref:J domain-containing protein n=1 Tax=Pseudovibrio flavus TaxID=2529854 RepID=UPI0012BD676E|nr:J domain-containing protein [Pseudovibrio flavus]MTI18295.1 molecular chaperone DnaJ [Pseudovibrio flavus]